MRDASIAELEALPKEAGDWSTPVYSKDFYSHRWEDTGLSGCLHFKDWGAAIAIIEKVDPEFYARYTTVQATVQPDYRALYNEERHKRFMLELEVNHLKAMVELYKSFR